MVEAASPSVGMWWQEQGLELRVNGVFKGGGAKGILYGGALQSLAKRGLWFRAVGGSSAGAITAALIAAGLGPDQIIAHAPAGLRGVQRMLLADLVGSPLFRVAGLAKWLEQLLRDQVTAFTGEPTTEQVTFARLFEAARIELYVVTVDVADRQPRVFSAMTTPDLSVTSAVLASSAIPIAFRPGRLEVRDGADGRAVHRLIDGGVWANYPAFVFREPSFRAFHGLEPVPEDSLTVGFTLDTDTVDARKTAVGFRTRMDGVSRDRGSFMPWIFRNPLGRLYFMTVAPLVVAAEFWYSTHAAGGLTFLNRYATSPDVPAWLRSVADFFAGFFFNFSPAYLGIFVSLILVALVAALLGGTLLDSGVPAMRTLMSVGTDVPYWVGADPHDHVVRLKVPTWLTTTKFKLPDHRVTEAVAEGRRQAEPQFDAILSV
jgi:predicted acylesterase/phospholipase RssA